MLNWKKSLGICLLITLLLSGSGCNSDSLSITGSTDSKTASLEKEERSKNRQLPKQGKNLLEGRCRHFSATGIALFGDLHVHTALSLDAYQQDVRTMPADAYAFAQGKLIPFHDDSIQIDRPLDFAAVTDHAEFLGDLEKCRQGGDMTVPAASCERVLTGTGAAHQLLQNAFRENTNGSRVERVNHALELLFKSENPVLNTELCGVNGELCREHAETAWQHIQNAAEDAYDRSPECRFTSFVGYEYSGVLTGSNYHRNVIFKNHRVPGLPVSYLDAPRDVQLWKALRRKCHEDLYDCDFIAIPHNPNLSNGLLLTPDYSMADNDEEQKALAKLRQVSEPLLEIFQHKGQSECINGLSSYDNEYDPLCEFEQVRVIGGSTSILDTPLVTNECPRSETFGGMIDTGCISKNDFLRGALLTGLEEESRLGVNPLKLGVIASSDTHESTPGAVDEQSWRGHVGREFELASRLQKKTGLPYRLQGNPGGLTGVWARENTREEIFAALKRRETFATSGPRIQPRFFASWHYADDICETPQMLERAYANGIPMGGTLTAATQRDAAPVFLMAALRDPIGQQLQALQLIKGWVDQQGSTHVRVIEAGQEETGYDSLCRVYTDTDFEPGEAAYYYMRVVEQASPRWSHAQCLALDTNERPVECHNEAEDFIRELAWTSPIWYQPATTN